MADLSVVAASVEADVIGLVHVVIVEGKKLPAKDLNHSSDPFVVIHYGDNSQRTTIKKKTLNPYWMESFNFLTTHHTQSYSIRFDVWDWDRATNNDYIGFAEYSTAELFKPNPTKEKEEVENEIELELHDKQGKSQGSIIIRIKPRNRAEVERTFWTAAMKTYDSDGNGDLDRMELSAMVEALEGKLTDNEIDDLFKAIDIKQDGKISQQEFLNWVLQNGNAQKMMGFPDMLWQLAVFMEDEQDAASVLQDVDRYISTNSQVHKTPTTFSTFGAAMKIFVRDRKTGILIEEKISSAVKTAMRIMYSNMGGRKTVSSGKVKNLLRHITESQGKQYDNPKSKAQIAKFVAFHSLNTDELLIPLEEYETFNQFFYRKLINGSRPIDHPTNPSIAVSPADCRLSAFQTLDKATQLWIKSSSFNLTTLLQDDQLASEFNNCSLVIARLSPQDYHRFHSPIEGNFVNEFVPIDGTYYTVNPIAVQHNIDVYGENKRVISMIDSPIFGKVLYICIGATCVGSINYTVQPGQHVNKGDEVGYFAFGGSTVVLLFKQGAITLDSDLIANSSKPIETLVRVGYSIGHH